LTLSRPSSGLALFKVIILSRSMLPLVNVTAMRISPVHPVDPPLSMGVERFL
jgi:hypothetical protein